MTLLHHYIKSKHSEKLAKVFTETYEDADLCNYQGDDLQAIANELKPLICIFSDRTKAEVWFYLERLQEEIDNRKF